MGIEGACGSTNLTSSSLCLLLQFCTADAHPCPVSPSPWAKMTVAVCFWGAGNTSGAVRRIADMAAASVGFELELCVVVVSRGSGTLPESSKAPAGHVVAMSSAIRGDVVGQIVGGAIAAWVMQMKMQKQRRRRAALSDEILRVIRC
jgi:hypothetical protein